MRSKKEIQNIAKLINVRNIFITPLKKDFNEFFEVSIQTCTK
jgi:predicted methyltransferase